MERKNFNITLDLLVDEEATFTDLKLEIYWKAYEMAADAEKKARKKEKRLEEEMYEAVGDEAFKEAENKWKKAMKDATITRELRHIAWTAYYQGSKQLEAAKVGEN